MMQNNIFSILSQYGSFMQNPQALLKSRFNLPQNVNLNNPQDVMQGLLNLGAVNQSQINQANQMAQQIRNNPTFQNMFR